MSEFKDVLRRYAPEAALGSGKTAVKTAIDRSSLQADLQGVVARNRVYFNLALGMPLVLFAGLMVAVLSHLDQPEWVRGLSVATGVSFIGMIKVMANLWKAKVSADTMIALAGSLPDDALQIVIGTLIRKM